MSENESRVERRKQVKKQQPKSKKNIWKKILKAVLIAGMLMLMIGAGAFLWIIKDAPKFDETLLKAPLSSTLYASDEKTIIAEIGTEKRDAVDVEQIPDVLKNAVIATEDARFYKHHGIDVKRTLVAIFNIITSGSFEGGGGSTITQQLVKNSFLSIEQTPTRKIQEWYLALQLERRFSKDQILEMYFNKNLYGGDVYGVAKAAERFFGLGPDELDQLTLEQAALLAGIPQSPNRYIPTEEDNWEKAEKRRNMVLHYMNRHGYLSKIEMTEAQSTPIEETLNIQMPKTNQYQAFVNTVIKEVQEKTDANIFEAGLEIYTTIDPEIQQITEEVLSTNDYISFPDSENLQSAVVITDTQTGAIKAIGGGRNYQNGGFNYATMMKRQPGSTIKPILDYGPAIDQLKWSTGHMLKDEEYQYANGTPIRNANRKYAGNRTIRDHLSWSRNIPALKAFQAAGVDKATHFARSLGFPITEEQKINEANAIGGIDAASPVVMAGAYAAFGNGGYYIKPHTVTKMVYPDGIEKNLVPEKKRVMEDYTAFLLTDMLRTAVDSGTGTQANISRLDLAGKTGTTNFDKQTEAKYGLPASAVKDAWFVGYTPQYTGAVWTGFGKTTSANDYLNRTSENFSKLIFKAILSKAATSTEKFKQPSSVAKSGNEYYVIGSEKPEAPKPKEPTNVTAQYDEASDRILLSWNHASNDRADITFDVSYTVEGGDSTKLTSTDELQAALLSPEKGKEYTFTIAAVSGDTKSNTASTSITVGEKEEVPDRPSHVQAVYDIRSNAIVVSWNHNNEDSNNVQYTVTYTVNGTTKTLTSTTQSQAVLSSPQPGQTYEFTVTASNQAGKSEPVSTSVSVEELDRGERDDGENDTDSGMNSEQEEVWQ